MSFSRLMMAGALFAGGVLLFTRLDYLLNEQMRSQLSIPSLAAYPFYAEYSLLYFLLYQLLIGLIWLFTRSVAAVALMEAFVLSSTQDLVYFAVWQGGFPSCEWSWMPMYRVLGHWTTENQFCFSAVALVVGAVVAWLAS